MGNTAHGNRMFGIGIAGGEGYLHFPGRGFGILEKKFVKISHTIKKKRIGIFFFDAQVLLQHGGEFCFGHTYKKLVVKRFTESDRVPGLATGTDIKKLFPLQAAVGADKPFYPPGTCEKKFQLHLEYRTQGLFGHGKKQHFQAGRPKIGIKHKGLFKPGLSLFGFIGLNKKQ